MGGIRKAARLIHVNWRTLAGFEILYKILSLAVFTPLCWGIFNLVMDITGYKYLTIENIIPFLLNPFTIIVLFILLICMAVYTMADIGAVIFILDQSCQGVKTTISQTVKYALVNAVKVFKGKNILIVFVVLFLIPFMNMGVASGYVSSIAVPEFIMDFITGNTGLLVLFFIVFIGLAALLLKWVYAFHYFTLEGGSFKEARTKSARLSHNNKIKDLFFLLGVQCLFYIVYFILLFAGIIVAVLLGSLFPKMELVGIVSASVIWVFIAVSFLVVSALVTPASYACISILFYRHKEAVNEEIIHIKVPQGQENIKGRRIVHIAEWFLFIISVAFCSLYMYGLYNNKINIQAEYVRTMAVTAHRGASRNYPENTMAAFKGAKKLGAGWIELDVQQSRDGMIFVMHDTNFKRTTGVNKNTWEMDYKEISRLDAGSFFNSSFAGEKVPLLSEVIAFAKKNKIKLNIELKPSGHEREFEQKVADIIEAEDFYNNCVITSQVYEVLENVKAYNENIQTVYVMSLAYGDINQLKAADHFSIEATSITEKIVSDVHNAGKEIYAWTVNTEESINNMISLNVDNIITDDITLAKECIFLSKTGDVIAEYIKIVTE